MKKEVKRFQECNKIVQLWRYRWYLCIPFIVIWYKIFGLKTLVHIIPETEDENISLLGLDKDKLKFPVFIRNRNLSQLIKIAKGEMQIKMCWYYTSDEVFSNIKNRLRDKNFKKF